MGSGEESAGFEPNFVQAVLRQLLCIAKENGLSSHGSLAREVDVLLASLWNTLTGSPARSLVRGTTPERELQTMPDLRAEILYGSKLSALAYATPELFPQCSEALSLPPPLFSLRVRNLVRASNGPKRSSAGDGGRPGTLASRGLTGFYVRTPVRLWNRRSERVKTLVEWKERSRLLAYRVKGNVNVYVCRRERGPPSARRSFELYVLFRGTSNEFNGIPQYGDGIGNTPVMRVPEFHLERASAHPGGSHKVPLFYFYYGEMVLDVKEHIYNCLRHLGVESPRCARVVVAGHSMGGALTTTFAYASYKDRREWWRKFQFRTYGAPLCCNDAACTKLERWIRRSRDPRKFLDVVNEDDVVNIRYMFGGKGAMEDAVRRGLVYLQKGGERVAGSWEFLHDVWTRDEDPSRDKPSGGRRAVDPGVDVGYSALLRGMASSQTSNPLGGGVRPSFPGRRGMHGRKPGILSILCHRPYHPGEFPGSSHFVYLGLTMRPLWKHTRVEEEKFYKELVRESLDSERNRLQIITFVPPPSPRERAPDDPGRDGSTLESTLDDPSIIHDHL